MSARILLVVVALLIVLPANGQTVELSGTVLDADGRPILGTAFIQAYDPATYEIAGEARTDQDKRYSMSLAAGAYRLYVREFGFVPIDIGPFEITSDTEMDLQITEPGGRFFSQRQLFSPAIVFADGTSSTDLELDFFHAEGIDSAFVYNEFGNFSVEGATLAKYQVFDDGTRGDRAAGDGVYGREGFLPGTDQDEAFVIYAQVWSGGVPEVVYLSGASVSLVDPTWQRFQATPISPELAVGDYVVNFAIGPYQSRWDWTRSVRSFYQLFEDAYDFLFVFVGDDTRPRRLNNFHVPVRNEIDGIGDPFGFNSIDVSGAFGSEAKLRGLNLFPFPSPDPPMLHELAHYWANHLPIFGQRDYAGGHWGYSSVDGVLGGYPEGTLTDLGGGVYTNNYAFTHGWARDEKAYADLELYLMGLIPIEEVRESFEVLLDPQEAGYPNVTGTLATITRSDILAALGNRTPDVTTSQKSFRVGFVVITTELMGEAEATLISRLARRLSGEIQVDGRLSFHDATGGRADLTVEMSPPTRAPSEITGDRLITVDWSSSTIFSADLAGLAQADVLYARDAGLSSPDRLAYDEQGRMLYWVDNDNDIMRAPLDGGSVEPLGLKAPGGGLAVDGPSESLFYADFNNRIVRVDIPTGGETILTEPSGWIPDIAVDQAGAKILWPDGNVLRRADLDGSRPEELTELDNLISVAVAGQSGQIFLATADDPTYSGKLYRLEAAGPVELGDYENSRAYRLAPSPSGDRLFWSSSSQAFELSGGENRMIDEAWQSIGGIVYVPKVEGSATVSGLTSAQGNGVLDLSWAAVADARYRVQIGVEGDPDALADIGGLTEANLTWEVPSEGAGVTILWRVLATTPTQMGAWSDQAATGTGVGVDRADLPDALTLSPSYPNPFGDHAHIRYSLPESGPVRLTVFDMLGRRVAVLQKGLMPAGWHEVSLAGTGLGLTPGVYHVVLEKGSERRVRQVVRVR